MSPYLYEVICWLHKRSIIPISFLAKGLKYFTNIRVQIKIFVCINQENRNVLEAHVTQEKYTCARVKQNQSHNEHMYNSFNYNKNQ